MFPPRLHVPVTLLAARSAPLVQDPVVDVAADGVNDAEGIEVVGAALGPAFPKGLFVARDGSNTRLAGNQN